MKRNKRKMKEWREEGVRVFMKGRVWVYVHEGGRVWVYVHEGGICACFHEGGRVWVCS